MTQLTASAIELLEHELSAAQARVRELEADKKNISDVMEGWRKRCDASLARVRELEGHHKEHVNFIMAAYDERIHNQKVIIEKQEAIISQLQATVREKSGYLMTDGR